MNEAGRHGFIVALSLVFGTRFADLRAVISEQGGAEWWSSYGSFAGGLFSGIEIRNVILILANGAGKFSTQHNSFSVETRSLVFGQLEYHESSRGIEENPLRSGLPVQLAENLREIGSQWAGSEHSESEETQFVYLRPTAGYWFPVLPKQSPIFEQDFSIREPSDSLVKAIPLRQSENWTVTLAALGGKIGYFWWFVTGDNFHANPREADAVRALADKALKQSSVVFERAQKVLSQVPRATIFVSHKGIRPNIRWSELADATDLLDFSILEAVGLEEEWRRLNIWYRQAMKSSGHSPKDRQAPEGFENFFSHA